MSSPILTDTSVWVAHLRGRAPAFRAFLDDPRIHIHPFVVGELLLGFLARGHAVLGELNTIPRLPVVDHDAVVGVVNSRRLQGSGIGWIDAHLLASAEAARAQIWTLDSALGTAARRTGVGLFVV